MAAASLTVAAVVLFMMSSVCIVGGVQGEEIWQPATATWYGSPNGAGTDGGACGYGKLPGSPYGLDVGAGSPVLFKRGIGCGSCFQVKCENSNVCSEAAVRVVITDECPGGYCAFGRTHFDLSGTAFGRMAASGKTSQLLASGVIPILYRRAECVYRHEKGVVFEIANGATPYWFSVIIRYLDGPGDLSAVELQQAGSDKWQRMSQVWGANWCVNSGPLRAPFSIRMTALETGQKITAYNVIPEKWSPQQSYIAHVNFNI